MRPCQAMRIVNIHAGVLYEAIHAEHTQINESPCKLPTQFGQQ
jgi:hypothetical protein